MSRKAKKAIKFCFFAGIFLLIAYFLPIPLFILVMCGLWDVSRNRDLDLSVLKQYFLKNGIGTWFASPLNILLDLLALPYFNKGVYKLTDLPEAYQSEINGLIDAAKEQKLIEQLESKTRGHRRAMFFFKWYGENNDTGLNIPAFQKDFRFVRTIGVSVFRERESTSRHFGPFRPSLRVLYCLNDDVGEDAYIKVGPVENHWRSDPLFIFDDTLLHQSFNETDAPRYVLWADILRPSYIPPVFDLAMNCIRVVFKRTNGVFYKNWKLIDNQME